MQAFGRRRRLGNAALPCQSRNGRAIAPAHDRAERTACHDLRGRRLHRPLRLRVSVQDAACGSASRAATRATPISSSRSAQVGQFGFEQADITDPAQRPQRGQERDGGRQPRRSLRPPMHAVHVEGARNVAEAARDAGAGALGPHLGDRRRPEFAVRATAAPRAKASGGPRCLPRRDDHPPVARLRAGGRPHQPLRRRWRACRSFR